MEPWLLALCPCTQALVFHIDSTYSYFAAASSCYCRNSGLQEVFLCPHSHLFLEIPGDCLVGVDQWILV